MNPKELIKAGRLPEARKQLTEEVKSSPSNVSSRTLLFQVLSFYGEWAKAEKHLETIATQDSKREIGVQIYKNLIHAEKERPEVLKRNARPSFFPHTPPYLEAYFLAWEKMEKKRFEEAQEIFDQIDENRLLISGTLNGKDFVGFGDTDAFLSFFLEAFIYERYVWIPFESIRELQVSSPKTLFDLLWVEAHVTTWEGLGINCYLPVLYPESFLHEDDRVKLGRMTDWIPLGDSFSKGVGQHVYQVGEEEIAILELKEVRFKIPGAEKGNEKSD
jgi:type VI secretion system protein ImpE